MSRGATRPQSGFTMLELLIGISLFLIALTTITLALDANRRSYLRGEIKMDVQQSARVALSTMSTQFRMAGYFPENFADPAADPPVINSVQIATDQAVALHGDLDSSGSSNVFLYCLDGSTLRRGKAPDGDTTAYWCPAGEILADNVDSLRFDYFDEDNTPIPNPSTGSFSLDGEGVGAVPDLTDLTQRGAVRRMLITITVTQDVPALGPQVFQLGSEVRLRNVR